MPPKNSGFQVDVEKIPLHQRGTLDLSLEGIFLYYNFARLVFDIRVFSCIKSIFLGSKPVVSAGKPDSNDKFFLITLKYENCETQIVMGLGDIYFYGVKCSGKWLYPRDSLITIKGGFKAKFSMTYPDKMDFYVGLEVLRNSVLNIHSDDVSNWAKAYHNLCLNLAEPIRFHSMMLYVWREGKHLLEPVDQWVVNNWGVLSKMWKILCRYGKWNPKKEICHVDDTLATSILGIVLDAEITKTEYVTLDKLNRAIHPDIK